MTLRKKIRLKFVFVALFALFVGALAYPQTLGFAPSLQEKISALRINLGLDLQGGLHVEYAMDLSGVENGKKSDAKNAAQAVIERRVNAFGVGESQVYIAERGEESFLVVELPGVSNVEEAKSMLQETPFLEFREERSQEEIDKLLETNNSEARTQAEELLTRVQNGEDFGELASEHSDDPISAASGGDLGFVVPGTFVPEFDAVLFDNDLTDGTIYNQVIETSFGYHIIKKNEQRPARSADAQTSAGGSEGEEREIRAQHILIAKAGAESLSDQDRFVPTELTGEHLEGAAASFGGGGSAGGLSEPEVLLDFTSEGSDIFADVSGRNVGKQVATYIDGELVSAPVIQTEITGGTAVITGNFTTESAKELAGRLNEGALPVPIELVSQQSIDASLGVEALRVGIKAGLVGLALTMLYMIFYYRLFGVVAAVALLIYAAMMVAFFKLSILLPSVFHITLTLSGIAGLILSIGMAVDANILIFERIREELRAGRSLQLAINEGFARAWTSIRDGNLSTIITSLILMWVSTGFIKGFALILIFGVLLSMFTAIVLVRIIINFIANDWVESRPWLIMGSAKTTNEKE